MTPQELKKSIMRLAMQGKLTEQLIEDGDARDIIPYLNIDKKIEPNEEPFDIPDNWLWIPVGNLGKSTGTDSFSDGPFGSNLKTVHYIDKPEVRIIQLSNIGDGGWRDKNVKFTSHKHLDEVIPRCEVFPGDFVIAKMMPAGRTIQVPDLGTRITLGSDALKFVPNPILNKKFLLFAMNSAAFLEQVYAEAHGITRVRTTLKGVKRYVLPIPPLEEQKRIVAKIEELLPYIDKYEKAWTKLEEFNKKFPDDMQKSILQMAIQGKLVEQRAEEGTAEVLYKKIQEEKQKLINEGKIKKQKALPEITDDEIPFDIPDSWKWVRLGDLCTKLVDGDHNPPKGESVKTQYRMLSAQNINDDKIVDLESARYLSKDNYIKTNERTCLTSGDVLFTIVGSMGRSCVFDGNESFTFQRSVAVITCLIFNYYFKYVLDAPLTQNFMYANATGTAQKGFYLNQVEKLLIPLPPLQEQKRIVAKIEELLPKCLRLKEV